MRNHTKFHWFHQPSVWTCTVKCNHYTSLVPRAGKQIWILFEFFANKKRAGDEILFPQTMMARWLCGYVWCNVMGILLFCINREFLHYMLAWWAPILLILSCSHANQLYGVFRFGQIYWITIDCLLSCTEINMASSVPPLDFQIMLFIYCNHSMVSFSPFLAN